MSSSCGGGVVAGLYTVGLAHLGSRLGGADLAAANAAFIFCYSLGMLVGPQTLGTRDGSVRPERLRLCARRVLRGLHPGDRCRTLRRPS